MDSFITIVIWIFLALLVASFGSDRKIGFLVSLLISIFLSPIIGLIFVLFSDKKSKISHRFKDPYENAKKEEFKGNTEKAIDLYGDALYYLENDYKNTVGRDEIERNKLITSIKEKVEALKSKL
jgi:hypothetical protein